MIPSHRDALSGGRSRSRRRPAIACERLEGRELLSGFAQDVKQLAVDLAGLHKGSNVTPAEIKAVAADLTAIGAVATKPSASSVSALEAEIKLVAAGGSITPAEAVALKKDVAAVLASANVPAALAQQAATDIHTVITASGVTKADLKTIAADVEAIVADLGSLKK